MTFLKCLNLWSFISFLRTKMIQESWYLMWFHMYSKRKGEKKEHLL